MTTPSVPTTMRAAVLCAQGEPLQLQTLRTPRPKSGEVLLRVTACGLCHSDLHVLGGSIAFPTPAVVGHEVSGTIVELGSGMYGSDLEVGDVVAAGFLMPCGQCAACREGREELCSRFFEMNRLQGTLYDGNTRLYTIDGDPVWIYSMGGLAEYAVVPVTAVAPLSAGMDPLSASILGCAAMTAFGAIRRAADLRYGETVSVVAIGGVGSAVIQIARAMGATRVIAIDIDDQKLHAARELGATDVVNSRTTDVREAVLAATAGRGVDVAFEVLGAPATWTTALDTLADGGRMIAIGLGAGIQRQRSKSTALFGGATLSVGPTAHGPGSISQPSSTSPPAACSTWSGWSTTHSASTR